MRLYIAGPLTPTGRYDNPAVEYLMNVRQAARCGKKLIRVGHTPFVPALDYLYYLSLDDGESEFSEAEIKSMNMGMLSGCEGIVLLDGWESSNGVAAELAEAKRLGMKVFRFVANRLVDITGQLEILEI